MEVRERERYLRETKHEKVSGETFTWDSLHIKSHFFPLTKWKISKSTFQHQEWIISNPNLPGMREK